MPGRLHFCYRPAPHSPLLPPPGTWTQVSAASSAGLQGFWRRPVTLLAPVCRVSADRRHGKMERGEKLAQACDIAGAGLQGFWHRPVTLLVPVCRVFGASLLKVRRPAPGICRTGRTVALACRVFGASLLKVRRPTPGICRTGRTVALVCRVFGASLLKVRRPAPGICRTGRRVAPACWVSADRRHGKMERGEKLADLRHESDKKGPGNRTSRTRSLQFEWVSARRTLGSRRCSPANLRRVPKITPEQSTHRTAPEPAPDQHQTGTRTSTRTAPEPAPDQHQNSTRPDQTGTGTSPAPPQRKPTSSRGTRPCSRPIRRPGPRGRAGRPGWAPSRVQT